MNAIELLKSDHARVQELFQQYDAAANCPERQREIAEQIFVELDVHATLEEELFYPALRGQIGSEAADGEGEVEEEDLVAEALEEHQDVKTLIRELRALDPGDEGFRTIFVELRESVEEHVGMEEDELMPDATAILGNALDELGRQLEERKGQLMAGKP